jgi:hypothetical protein
LCLKKEEIMMSNTTKTCIALRNQSHKMIMAALLGTTILSVPLLGLPSIALADPFKPNYTDTELGATLHGQYQVVAPGTRSVTFTFYTLKAANFELVPGSVSKFRDADGEIALDSCRNLQGEAVRGALTLGLDPAGTGFSATKTATASDNLSATYRFDLPADAAPGIYEFEVRMKPTTGPKTGASEWDVARAIVEVTQVPREIVNGAPKDTTKLTRGNATYDIAYYVDYSKLNVNPTVVLKNSKGADVTCPRKRAGTAEDPFVSLTAAAFSTVPGDVVLVRNGNYTTTSSLGALTQKRSGLPGKPIIFLAESKAVVLSNTGSQNVVTISGSYNRLDGFTINGPADPNSATPIALGAPSDLPGADTAYGYHKAIIKNPVGVTPGANKFAQNGVSIKPVNGQAETPTGTEPRDNGYNSRYVVHHVEIINNQIQNASANCIQADTVDYLMISDNRIRNCANFSSTGGSGISIFHPYDTDTPSVSVGHGNSVSGTTVDYGTAFDLTDPVFNRYKIVVANNVVSDAIALTPWAKTAGCASQPTPAYLNPYGKTNACSTWSDGNGIIIDDTRNGQVDGLPYKSKLLLFNNVVTNSGGAGIQVFASRNVHLFHNTVYANVKAYTLGNVADITTGTADQKFLQKTGRVLAYEKYGEIYANGVEKVVIQNNLVAPQSTARGAAFAKGEITNLNSNPVLKGNLYQDGRIAIDQTKFIEVTNNAVAPATPVISFNGSTFVPTGVPTSGNTIATTIPNTGIYTGLPTSLDPMKGFKGFLGAPSFPITVDMIADIKVVKRAKPNPKPGAVEY